MVSKSAYLRTGGVKYGLGLGHGYIYVFYSGALHAEHRKFPGDKFLHGKLRGNGGF